MIQYKQICAVGNNKMNKRKRVNESEMGVGWCRRCSSFIIHRYCRNCKMGKRFICIYEILKLHARATTQRKWKKERMKQSISHTFENSFNEFSIAICCCCHTHRWVEGGDWCQKYMPTLSFQYMDPYPLFTGKAINGFSYTRINLLSSNTEHFDNREHI